MKFAVAHDLSILNNLPKIDRIAIAGQLDGLIGQINQLKQGKPIIDNAKEITVNNQSMWSKFKDNIKNTFYKVVSVTKSNGNSSHILMSTEEKIVLDSVKINLLSARIALLQHDQANWVASLTNVKSLVKEYYNNLDGTDNVTKELDTLIAIHIVNEHVNIDDTLIQLTKLNSLKE